MTKRMTIHLDDALDNDFRRVVGESYGAGRGMIKVAITEAIKDWLKKPRKKSK